MVLVLDCGGVLSDNARSQGQGRHDGVTIYKAAKPGAYAFVHMWLASGGRICVVSRVNFPSKRHWVIRFCEALGLDTGCVHLVRERSEKGPCARRLGCTGVVDDSSDCLWHIARHCWQELDDRAFIQFGGTWRRQGVWDAWCEDRVRILSSWEDVAARLGVDTSRWSAWESLCRCGPPNRPHDADTVRDLLSAAASARAPVLQAASASARAPVLKAASASRRSPFSPVAVPDETDEEKDRDKEKEEREEDQEEQGSLPDWSPDADAAAKPANSSSSSRSKSSASSSSSEEAAVSAKPKLATVPEKSVAVSATEDQATGQEGSAVAVSATQTPPATGQEGSAEAVALSATQTPPPKASAEVAPPGKAEPGKDQEATPKAEAGATPGKDDKEAAAAQSQAPRRVAVKSKPKLKGSVALGSDSAAQAEAPSRMPPAKAKPKPKAKAATDPPAGTDAAGPPAAPAGAPNLKAAAPPPKTVTLKPAAAAPPAAPPTRTPPEPKSAASLLAEVKSLLRAADRVAKALPAAASSSSWEEAPPPPAAPGSSSWEGAPPPPAWGGRHPQSGWTARKKARAQAHRAGAGGGAPRIIGVPMCWKCQRNNPGAACPQQMCGPCCTGRTWSQWQSAPCPQHG